MRTPASLWFIHGKGMGSFPIYSNCHNVWIESFNTIPSQFLLSPLPCRLRLLFGRYYKDCWRQLPHILHTGHTQCINVQPHTRYTRMEACWDRLAGNGSGLGHVNTVHGRFTLPHCSATEKDSTPDLFGDRYTYRCIITNDWDSEEKNVIETYNKRGARERDFDRLNNDFVWKHLPCSFLNENTVYMILTAFCMNFFSYFIRAVSSVFTSLSPTSRVKKFEDFVC